MKHSILVLVLSLGILTCGFQGTKLTAEEKTNSDIATVAEKIDPTPTPPKKSAKKTEKIMSDEIRNVSIEAKAEKVGDEIIITYNVKNSSEQKIYLWDKMIGYDGNKQIIDNEAAYVFYEEPKTIRVARANLPLPFDRDVARKEIPFSRIVEPKSTATGKITLKSPVKEFSPFYEALNDEKPKIEKCDKIRLLIGWSNLRDGMNITERKIGDETVLAIRGGWKEPYHYLLEAKISLETDLQVYQETFDRNLPLH